MLALARHIALAMLALLVLLGVFLFVNEQGWVGAGDYDQPQALRFVLSQLPSVALGFTPVAVLLGALLGVGQLARGSEITVMRAAGMSVARIAGSIAMAGVLLVPPLAAIGEWVAPSLAQAGRMIKAQQRGGERPADGAAVWLRDGHRLVRADPGGGLSVFTLDQERGLVSVSRAAQGKRIAPGSWTLSEQASTTFGSDVVSSAHLAVGTLQTTVDAEQLPLASHDPRQQSVGQLAADIRILEARQQDTRRQRFALWSAVARLVALPLAMLLALPLLLGFLRQRESGARASVALTLGLFYFIAQRMVESGAVVFAVSPSLLAWSPTLLLGAAVMLLLWRTRGVPAR